MKMPKLLLFIPVLIFLQLGTAAQSRNSNKKAIEKMPEEAVLNARLAVNLSFAQNQLIITNLQQDQYDKILVFNMQGAIVLQQTVKTATVRLDINGLDEGVYLLALHSSATLKEKSLKFVVRK